MNREADHAIRALAAGFGATREDLLRIAATLSDSSVPRLSEFAPVARRLLSGRTADTCHHHIDRLVAQLGALRLDEITLLDLEQAALEVRGDALNQPGTRHGYGAPGELRQRRPLRLRVRGQGRAPA